MRYLCFIFFVANAFAQDIDIDITKKVEERFKPIPRYTEPTHVNTAIYEYPYRPVSLSLIQISKIVQKSLKKNAAIQSLSTLKLEINNRDLTVQVHEQADEHGFFYLVNRDGTVTRRVHQQYVKDISAVTEMYEPPKTYVEISKPKNISPYDPKAGLLSQFYLRLGQTSAKWTADLVNDARDSSAISTTLATNLMLDWHEEFRMGATLQYETSTHSTPAGSAQYKNPSIGLVLQSPPSYWGGGPWRVGAQFRTGQFASLDIPSANGRPTSVKLRTTTIQLDWQYFSANRWGEWSVGLAFQRDYPKIRRQENTAFLESDARTNDQVGLFVSQGFTW